MLDKIIINIKSRRLEIFKIILEFYNISLLENDWQHLKRFKSNKVNKNEGVCQHFTDFIKYESIVGRLQQSVSV